MNLCHGRPNGLQMSFREQEETVSIPWRDGATSQQLTGPGRGGVAVALCPDRTKRVSATTRAAGSEALGPELAEAG